VKVGFRHAVFAKRNRRHPAVAIAHRQPENIQRGVDGFTAATDLAIGEIQAL
jgi:hypothetical protein